MFEHDLTFIDRGNGFYEVVPMGYSKASGMQFLMDHFAIAKEDTIAIGDSTNDLPMLSYAGTGIHGVAVQFGFSGQQTLKQI